MFGSVVAVAFQNVFHTEIYQNNIFFYFLKLFLKLAYQNDPKHTKQNYFLEKIKNLNFYGTRCKLRFQTVLLKIVCIYYSGWYIVFP